jgi:hypothetical protein
MTGRPRIVIYGTMNLNGRADLGAGMTGFRLSI